MVSVLNPELTSNGHSHSTTPELVAVVDALWRGVPTLEGELRHVLPQGLHQPSKDSLSFGLESRIIWWFHVDNLLIVLDVVSQGGADHIPIGEAGKAARKVAFWGPSGHCYGPKPEVQRRPYHQQRPKQKPAREPQKPPRL